MTRDTDSWFPLFEFQDWSYVSVSSGQSDDADDSGAAAAPPIEWAKGDFLCGQAFTAADGYTLGGVLSFRPGVQLEVSAKGTLGVGSNPCSFFGTGTGTTGPTKGAVYEFIGWVFPGNIQSGAARPVSISGSVRAVRGPDTSPEKELGGLPIGTAGAFKIVSRGPA